MAISPKSITSHPPARRPESRLYFNIIEDVLVSCPVATTPLFPRNVARDNPNLRTSSGVTFPMIGPLIPAVPNSFKAFLSTITLRGSRHAKVSYVYTIIVNPAYRRRREDVGGEFDRLSVNNALNFTEHSRERSSPIPNRLG